MYKKGSILLFALAVALIALVVFEVGIKDVLSPQRDVPEEASLVMENASPSTEAGSDNVSTSTPVEPLLEKEPSKTFETKTPQKMITPSSEKVPVYQTVSSTQQTSVEELPPPLILSSKYISHGDGALEASNIIFYTNLERQKEGLKPLSVNQELTEAAIGKMEHMFDNQYFAHVAPIDKEDVVHWATLAGYEYITVGENLAMGDFKNEEEMVQAWMNSPGHRANILRATYEEIGVAVGKGIFEGDEIWMGVQVFAVPTSSCITISKTLLSSIDSTKEIVEKIETDLASLEPTISSLQPTSQEAYDTYVQLVEEYNALVAKHKDLSLTLQNMIKTYNDQVQVYNTCIGSK